MAVRKTGLKITSDKKTILNGPATLITGVMPNCVSPGRRISLGSWNQGFRFEKLMLTPLKPTSFRRSGDCRPMASYCRSLTPERDSLRNQWKIKDGSLECAAGKNSPFGFRKERSDHTRSHFATSVNKEMRTC